MFSCKFSEIFRKTFFHRAPLVAASESCLAMEPQWCSKKTLKWNFSYEFWIKLFGSFPTNIYLFKVNIVDFVETKVNIVDFVEKGVKYAQR